VQTQCSLSPFLLGFGIDWYGWHGMAWHDVLLETMDYCGAVFLASL
jgi:hypothetical protein